MISSTLLSMVHQLFEIMLTHVHVWKKLLSCLMCTWVVLWILSCAQLTNMFKVHNKKIDQSDVFIVHFDHRHIKVVFLHLTVNKYLSAGCTRQVKIFWKKQKRNNCFVIKVAKPIPFSDLPLHRIETNYEIDMNICFRSKFVLGIPSALSLFRPV